MSYARVTYPDLTGAQGSFVVPFDFEDPSEIEVSLAGEALSSSSYALEGKTVRFTPNQFPEGTLVIRRRTDLSTLAATLLPASPLRSTDLIAVHKQVLHGLQEVYDGLEFLNADLGSDGTVSLPKEVVGLDKVENLTPYEMPVSTAVQAALDSKLDASEFDPANIYSIVVDRSGGTSGLNAETLAGETLSSLKDWRTIEHKPTAYPPTSHAHDAGDLTSGTLPAARVPSNAVTQHQGDLRLNYSQVIGAPPGQLGEVPEDDGSFYLRTQGAWVVFEPNSKADVSYVQAESARLEGLISSTAVEDVLGLSQALEPLAPKASSKAILLSPEYHGNVGGQFHYKRIASITENSGQIVIKGPLGGHTPNEGRTSVDLNFSLRNGFRASGLVIGKVGTAAWIEVRIAVDDGNLSAGPFSSRIDIYLVRSDYFQSNLQVYAVGGGVAYPDAEWSADEPVAPLTWTLQSYDPGHNGVRVLGDTPGSDVDLFAGSSSVWTEGNFNPDTKAAHGVSVINTNLTLSDAVSSPGKTIRVTGDCTLTLPNSLTDWEREIIVERDAELVLDLGNNLIVGPDGSLADTTDISSRTVVGPAKFKITTISESRLEVWL